MEKGAKASNLLRQLAHQRGKPQSKETVKDLVEKDPNKNTEEVQCPDCNTKMFMYQLEVHINFECQSRMANCQYCGVLIAVTQIENHKNECIASP